MSSMFSFEKVWPIQRRAVYTLALFHIQSTLSKMDTFGTGTKCPSHSESNKGSKERQGPTLSVHFTEVSVKRESTVMYLYIFLVRIEPDKNFLF